MLHPLHLYRTEVEKIIRFGSTTNEIAIRTVLNDFFRQHGVIKVTNLEKEKLRIIIKK